SGRAGVSESISRARRGAAEKHSAASRGATQSPNPGTASIPPFSSRARAAPTSRWRAASGSARGGRAKGEGPHAVGGGQPAADYAPGGAAPADLGDDVAGHDLDPGGAQFAVDAEGLAGEEHVLGEVRERGHDRYLLAGGEQDLGHRHRREIAVGVVDEDALAL